MRAFFTLLFSILVASSAVAGEISTPEQDAKKRATLHEIGEPVETYDTSEWGISPAFKDMVTGEACFPGDPACILTVMLSSTHPSEVRVRDGDGTALGDVETDAASFADDTFLGQVMLDFGFIHDGTNWQRIVSGAGAVDAGTQRVTLASDDPAVTNLTDIEGLLTSDNDAAELADYYDSTSQRSPFYTDDATLTLDNEPLADVMAAVYDAMLETTDGTSLGDILDDALYTSGAGGTRLADISNDIKGQLSSDNDGAELANYFDSVSQTSPLYADDATLTLDNEPLADIGAATYDTLTETTDGTSIGDILDDALYTSGAGGTRVTDEVTSIKTAVEIVDDWDGVEDAAIGTDGARVMFEARSSQKAAVGSGDNVIPVTDVYGQMIPANYEWATNAARIVEIDPISEHMGQALIADVTNGTDGTYDYYVDMDGYNTSSFQMELDGGSGDIDVSVECTTVDDGTAPGDGGRTYHDYTNALWGVLTVDTSGIYADDVGKMSDCKYLHVEVVAASGANDADWYIYGKWHY